MTITLSAWTLAILVSFALVGALAIFAGLLMALVMWMLSRSDRSGDEADDYRDQQADYELAKTSDHAFIEKDKRR
jgi:hypothetical protein